MTDLIHSLIGAATGSLKYFAVSASGSRTLDVNAKWPRVRSIWCKTLCTAWNAKTSSEFDSYSRKVEFLSASVQGLRERTRRLYSSIQHLSECSVEEI